MLRLALLWLVCVTPLWGVEVSDAQMESTLATWRRYRLPEPPEGSTLVKIRVELLTDVIDDETPTFSALAFQSTNPQSEHFYFIGVGNYMGGPWYAHVTGGRVLAAEPMVDLDKVDLKKIDLHRAAAGNDLLELNHAFGMGLNLWARGHKQLGKAMLAKSLENSPGHFPFEQWRTAELETDQVSVMLGNVIWASRANQLFEPESDRAALHKLMQQAFNEFEWLRTDELGVANKQLLDSLVKTLHPRQSEPGSVEADIDALVDLCQHGSAKFFRQDPDPLYTALLHRGFDAVPTLIAYLEDDRLTRSIDAYGEPRTPRAIRDVVSDLLMDVAGYELGHTDRHRPVKTETARAWWDKAKPLGEEEYLSRNLFVDVYVEEAANLQQGMLPLVALKYPRLLADRCKEALAAGKPPHPALTRYLAISSLDKSEKLALLGRGAESNDPETRWGSVSALWDVDTQAFVETLVKSLETLAVKPEEFGAEGSAAYAASLTTDSRVWEALARSAKRADPASRLDLLARLDHHPSDWNGRRQAAFAQTKTLRLGLLAAFLTDTTVVVRATTPNAEYVLRPSWSRISIQNYASILCGRILGVESEPDPDWTEYQWHSYRQTILTALTEAGVHTSEDAD